MRFSSELYDYQRAGVEKLRRVKVGALYMKMGTGKTRTALELINIRLREGKVKQVLWACPFSVQKDLYELLSEHAEGFEDAIRIVGIESLSQSARLVSECMEYVKSAATYLVVDESLLVKNPYAYRTKHIISISEKCPYKLILNGTPVSRNEADLFAQWYVLDWRILGYRSHWSFAANHLEMDPDRPGRVARVLNVDYLTRKIAPYTYEVSKDDALDLPPKQYASRLFWLTEEQEAHYAQIADELLMQVNEMRPATIYRLFSALQAITSGFAVRLEDKHSSLLRMYPPEENPRIITLLDLLDDIGEEQTVIYCRYTQEIMDICAVLGDMAVPYYGEMRQNERYTNKTRFRRGKARYLVANKSCAQFGLNLQFCRNEVFYNNDWDWATREQAEDRLHRVGQTQIVRVWDILARDTLDLTIQKSLLRKERLSDLFERALKEHNGVAHTVRAAMHGHLEG